MFKSTLVALAATGVILIISRAASFAEDTPTFSMYSTTQVVPSKETTKKFCPEAYAATARKEKVDVETSFGTLHGAGHVTLEEYRSSANIAIRCAHSASRTPTQKSRLLFFALDNLGGAVYETSDPVEKHDFIERERHIITEIRAIRKLPAGMIKDLNHIEDQL